MSIPTDGAALPPCVLLGNCIHVILSAPCVYIGLYCVDVIVAVVCTQLAH